MRIGIILCVIGMIWISIVFLEGNRVTEEFTLEPTNSHNIKVDLVGGEGIGYYKIFMPEFSSDELFIQIIDTKKNIISEQSIHTKMSVGYFDFKKNGEYSINILNISETLINLKVEFGNTNSQNMIPSGIIILVGTVLIILAAYLKLQNYKIEQPDENIS